jgi:large repetitive protein
VNSFAASTPSMNVARFGATATLLPSGKVLIAGGNTTGPFRGAFTPLNSTELYDPVTNSFAASTPSMNAARVSATATLLPNGKVLIAGGLISFDASVSIELYDPVSDSFAASTPTMNMSHFSGATATLLPNGKVLIAGGDCCGDAPGDIDLYDPVTNSFTASTPSMNAARASATATLLPNGKVLIAGGSANPKAVLNSTEIYTP